MLKYLIISLMMMSFVHVLAQGKEPQDQRSIQAKLKNGDLANNTF